MGDVVLHDWQRSRCLGYLTAWTARPKQPLQTVVATIETIVQKHRISAAELSGMIDAVYRESVLPFLESTFVDGWQRRQRLQTLSEGLRSKGLL